MIHIENLSLNLGKKEVLKNLSIDFFSGHIYGLFGKNGVGKTTLLRTLLGLYFPDEGTITINDYSPKDRHPDFQSDIFFLGEEIYLPELNFGGLVKHLGVFYPKFEEEKFEKILEEFELSVDFQYRKLSFGQKKKVKIAFGLATNASVILMDEPTNGLDILAKKQFRKVLASNINDENLMIIATHQVKDLESMIDHVVILDGHKILANKNVSQIEEELKNDLDSDIFLAGNGALNIEKFYEKTLTEN